MNKGIKKIISAGLCLCILLCTMCGCGITDMLSSFGSVKVLADDIIINPYSHIGFDSLDQTEQQMYREAASILHEYTASAKLGTGTKEQLNKVFTAIMADHPEYFYVNGYGVRECADGRIELSPVYTMTKSQYEERKAQIDSAVSAVLESAPADDDYLKAKYAFEYVVKYTDYVADAPENQNIYSVFVNHQSVCAGYARAVQLLLNKMGVECTYVTGKDLTAGTVHAWNIAKLDGEYYHIDATFGDAATANSENGVDIFYEYLNFDDDFALVTRTTDSVLDVPAATGFKDNYYVREGCYFESYNPEELAQVFLNAAQKFDMAVWLRFSDEQAFDDAVFGMIYQNDLTDVLHECKKINPAIDLGRIAYYQDDNLYTLIIML